MAPPSLDGRVALVTGASRGIGRGIALQLGESGATVYITGRSAANLQRTRDEVKARGARDAIAVVMDHAKERGLFRLEPCLTNREIGRSAKGLLPRRFPFADHAELPPRDGRCGRLACLGGRVAHLAARNV